MCVRSKQSEDQFNVSLLETECKPNPSPNAFPELCEWSSGRFLLKGRGTPDGSLFERKILVKSPEQGNRAQNKVEKLLQKL